MRQKKDEKKKAVKYFDEDAFVEAVLKAIKMDKAPDAVKRELSLEIAQTLRDRIIATVIAALGEKELLLLGNILKDHPELDEIDALSMITSYVPELDDRIAKVVDDFFVEMVENTKLIDESLAKKV